MHGFKDYIIENTKVKGVYRNSKLSASVDDLIKMTKDTTVETRDVKALAKKNYDMKTKEGRLDAMLEKPNDAFTKRMNAADMKYPILIDWEDYVIDGAHRLAKAYFNDQETIEVKVVSKEILNKAAEMRKDKKKKESRNNKNK